MKSFFSLLLSTVIFTTILLSSCIRENSGRKTDNLALAIDTNSLMIAYNVYSPDSLGSDNYEIFVSDFGGKSQKNVTHNADVSWTYHASGNKLFFVSDRDTCKRCIFLYEMNADGNNIRKITNFMLADSWMSSRKGGSEIILKPKSDSAFYIINPAGEILEKIFVPMPYFNDPAFSPDGKQIVFRAANKKSKQEPDFVDELYLMDADGSHLRKLTTYPDYDKTAPWYAYKSGPPKWHPSGKFITYQSFQKGRYALYAITPDGKKQWKLTENKWQEGYHDWSADGNWLAIELYDRKQDSYFIGVMNWKTKALRMITGKEFKYQQAPVFVNASKTE